MIATEGHHQAQGNPSLLMAAAWVLITGLGVAVLQALFPVRPVVLGVGAGGALLFAITWSGMTRREARQASPAASVPAKDPQVTSPGPDDSPGGTDDRITELVGVSEDERKRLATGLQDGPLQQLTAIGFKLARTQILMARGDVTGAQRLLVAVTGAVEREAKGLRQTMADLGAPALNDPRGLHGAIRDHLMRLGSTTHLECTIESELETRTSEALEIVLYRVAQEALANIVKHSSATRAAVSLFREYGSVVLSIRDDGVGFDAQAVLESTAAWKGFGLKYMQDRVRFAGGDFSIRSVRGAGTMIRAGIPESRYP